MSLNHKGYEYQYLCDIGIRYLWVSKGGFGTGDVVHNGSEKDPSVGGSSYVETYLLENYH